MNPPDQSLYELLGVAHDASTAELRAGYLKAAQTCHPDLNRDDQHADARFKLIRRVYEVLSDPVQRAAYDDAPDHYRIVGNDVTIDGRPLRKQPVYQSENWKEAADARPRDTGFRPSYGIDRRPWERVPGYLVGLTALVCVTLIPISLTRFLRKQVDPSNAATSSAEIESPEPLEANASFKERALGILDDLRAGVKQDEPTEAERPTVDTEPEANTARRSDEQLTSNDESSSGALASRQPQIEVDLNERHFEPVMLLETSADPYPALPLNPNDAQGIAHSIAPQAETFVPEGGGAPPIETEFSRPARPSAGMPKLTTPTNVNRIPAASVPSEAEWQRVGFGPSPFSTIPSYPVRYATGLTSRFVGSEEAPDFGASLPNSFAPTPSASAWGNQATGPRTLPSNSIPVNNGLTGGFGLGRTGNRSIAFSAVPPRPYANAPRPNFGAALNFAPHAMGPGRAAPLGPPTGWSVPSTGTSIDRLPVSPVTSRPPFSTPINSAY